MIRLFIPGIILATISAYDAPAFVSTTFSSNMVLQRDATNTMLHGWTKAASEAVTVSGSWFNSTIEATLSDDPYQQDAYYYWEAR